MKSSIYLTSTLAISMLTFLSACGGDGGGKSYPFEGKYELTTASCENTNMADIKAASVSTTPGQGNALDISGSSLKVSGQLAVCTFTASFEIKDVKNGVIYLKGGDLSASGPGQCEQLKTAMQQSGANPNGENLASGYTYNDPVLTLTNPNTGVCQVWRKVGTGSTTAAASTSAANSSSPATPPSDLASWLGSAYSWSSTPDYCRTLNDITSYNSQASYVTKSITIGNFNVTEVLYGTSGYENCEATLTFPITSSSSGKITYSSPSISLNFTYSTSTLTSCEGMRPNLQAFLAGITGAPYTKYYVSSSSRLEFTDPVNGYCRVLTK